MFSITHLLTCITGDPEYSSTTIDTASNFVILFSLFYLFGRFIFTKGSYYQRDTLKNLSVDYSCNKLLYSELIVFIVFITVTIFKMVLHIVQVGSLSNISWIALRRVSESLSYINIGQLLKLLFFLSSGIGLLLLLKKRWLLFSIVIITLAANVIISRNRVEVLPALVIPISYFMIKTKKLDLVKMVFYLLLAMFSIYVVYALRAFRHFGSFEDFFQNGSISDLNKKVIHHLISGDGELGLRRAFYLFIQSKNNFNNFGLGHTYLRMLLVFLPTKWTLGIKPPDFALSMGAAIGLAQGGSMHPTLFGDVYANFGIYGIFFGLFWAGLVSIFELLLARLDKPLNKILLFTLSGVVFAIMARGAVYNGYFILSYGALALFLNQWLRRCIT